MDMLHEDRGHPVCLKKPYDICKEMCYDVRGMESMRNELELYIHIPFCVRKCSYCDFLSAPAPEETQRAYVERLLEEIRGAEGLAGQYEVSTIFFGGGTPSILPGEALVEILRALRDVFTVRRNAEITVEANPGTVDSKKLRLYRQSGVNRLSLGLQSADDGELRELGRIHTWEEFLGSYQMAREAGFWNINVDLMSALPGQTVLSWQRTLEKVLALEPGPEHLSAYSLMLEEGTPFFDRYAEHRELLPSEDEERQMYYDTERILREHGYRRYEISNYAREGYECRHNLGYWSRTEYLGFGLGAASLIGNVRISNQCGLSEYLKGNFRGSREELTEQDIREEFFILGLRKMEGVDPGGYKEHYGKLLERLEEQKLLAWKDGRVVLTDRGIDVSNYVLAQFLDSPG